MILQALYQQGVPLADIRDIFDDYLKMPFDDIGIHGDKELLSESEFNILFKKLATGYPVCYLTGICHVRHLDLKVTEATLIPRTETIAFLYDTIKNNYDFNGKSVLDIGTGTGLIALSIKDLYPESQVTAVDISREALAVAKANGISNHLTVDFRLSDYYSAVLETYDVIISNPPYIEEGSTDVDAPYEPALALYSGKDGMDSYRALLEGLEAHLNPEGIAFFELESTNSLPVLALAKEKLGDGYVCELIQDMENKDRYLSIRRR